LSTYSATTSRRRSSTRLAQLGELVAGLLLFGGDARQIAHRVVMNKP